MLKTPHFEQSKDGYCLPACIRMVLAHWGDSISETQLAQQLKTKFYGTPISNARFVADWGYMVERKNLTITELKAYIENGIPVIVQVWMAMLDYLPKSFEESHVVVAVGFDDEYIFLHDPSANTGFQPLLWDGFLAAWAEYDETSVIIQPAN